MRLIKPESDSAKVTFPPPLVFVGFLLIGCAIDTVFGLRPAIPDGVRLWLGGGAILAGIAIVAAALVRFRKAGNDPEPWRHDAVFVAEGIYRFTRNPMYLGLTLASFGIAVAADCLGALLTLPLSVLVIRTQVIAREEAHLAVRFGDTYRDYCRRVRRWL